MAGGPAHVETLDWRPELKKLDGQPFLNRLLQVSNSLSYKVPSSSRGAIYRVQTPWSVGQMISDLFPNISEWPTSWPSFARCKRSDQITTRRTPLSIADRSSKVAPAWARGCCMDSVVKQKICPALSFSCHRANPVNNRFVHDNGQAAFCPANSKGFNFKPKVSRSIILVRQKVICQSTQRQVVDEIQRLNGPIGRAHT